jgi:tRNA (guanine26-N2/guanine27-N2)-dimethyltransferase
VIVLYDIIVSPFYFQMTTESTVIQEGSAKIQSDEAVFYNKIQEYNRDLSICAINVWSKLSNKPKPQRKGGNEDIAVEAEPIAEDVVPEVKEAAEEVSVSEEVAKQQEKRQKRVNQQLECLTHHSKDYPPLADSKREFTILEAFAATGLRSIRYAKEIKGVTKILANDLDPKAVASIERSSFENGVQNIVTGNVGDAQRVLYECLGNEKYDVVDLDPYGSSAPFLDGAVQAVANNGLLCVTCTDLAVLAVI